MPVGNSGICTDAEESLLQNPSRMQGQCNFNIKMCNNLTFMIYFLIQSVINPNIDAIKVKCCSDLSDAVVRKSLGKLKTFNTQNMAGYTH